MTIFVIRAHIFAVFHISLCFSKLNNLAFYLSVLARCSSGVVWCGLWHSLCLEFFVAGWKHLYGTTMCRSTLQRGCASIVLTAPALCLSNSPWKLWLQLWLWKSTGLLVILLLSGITSVIKALKLTRIWYTKWQWQPMLDGNSPCFWKCRYETPMTKCNSAVFVLGWISSYHSQTINANISLTKYLHNFYN